MIEKLKESHGAAFGFKVTGTLTGDDLVAITPEIERAIRDHGQPIGIVVDLSEMHGATWAGRWEEMKFLRHHTDHIARLAVVSDDKWEEIAEMTAIATASLQAAALYFHSTELHQAWQWARTSLHDDGMPRRVLFPGQGAFQDNTPEFPI